MTKLQKFAAAHNKLMKKFGVTLRFDLEFPGYVTVPLRARIAVWVLNKFNVTIKTTVVPVK